MYGRTSTLSGGLGSKRWGGTGPSSGKPSSSMKLGPLKTTPDKMGNMNPSWMASTNTMGGMQPPKIPPAPRPAAKVGYPKPAPSPSTQGAQKPAAASPLGGGFPRPGGGFPRPPWGGGTPNLDDWIGRPGPWPRPPGMPGGPGGPGGWPWPFPMPQWPPWQTGQRQQPPENPQQRWEREHGDAWRDQQDKEEWGRQYQDQHGGGYIPYWQRGLTQNQIQQQQYQHRQQNQQYIDNYWSERGLTSPEQISAHKQQQAWDRWRRHDPSQMETGQQRRQRRGDEFRQGKIQKQAEEEAARQKEQEESEVPGGGQQQGGGQQSQYASSIELEGYEQRNTPPGAHEQGYEHPVGSGNWWVKPKEEVGSGPSGGPDVGFPGQGEPGEGAQPIDPVDVGFPMGGGNRLTGLPWWYDPNAPLNSQTYTGQWADPSGSNWQQQYANPTQTPVDNFPDMFPGGNLPPGAIPQPSPPGPDWTDHPTGFDPQSQYAATGTGYYKPAYRGWY